MTTFEHAARSKKVARLVETLVKSGVSASVAREASNEDWIIAAQSAGVNTPSITTRDAVIKALEEIECKK